MTTNTFPVVIVGAGPAGVTAATLLGQYAIECLVLDRWSGVYPQPRAVHLDDEIYRILGHLGVADEFAAISRPSLGLQLRDNTMRVLAEFRRETTDGIHGYPKANMFDQPDLEAVLRENLSHYPTVTLRPNSEVTEIHQDDDTVLISYTDRPTGEQHTVTARYLLGCDGANSMVRAAIGSTMKDLKLEQRWLVIDVATAADLAQWDGVHQVCDPVRAATYMRIGPTRYRWEFRLLPGESAADFNDLSAVQPLLEPWIGNTDAAQLELVRVAEYTFRAKLADRWRVGNVFLLGDAAHLTPPFIGQGMGAGLRDAMNLAWKLAGVIDGALPESILDTYEQERRPHARTMILLALGMGKAMTEGGRFGDVLRRTIAPRLHHIPGLRATISHGATPPLSRSELVLKSLRPRQLTGTLCPNPVLDGERFDDIVGGGFTVVTTNTPSASQVRTIEARGAVVITTPADSELGRWLHGRRATVAIVRPDRTVMHAGRDLTAVALLPHLTLTHPQRKTTR
ncbi:bifunctional 3-(3-hydroxy-phenyl)propionate/3-hydroxycinnamic acid hydroxylase [Antrihabitans stalactiti]|uniref:Bifunctional 3-(3-hydroxy-phenyl)propionate/3-hydroxycinnamic acid hydroxylase n=1 Tax=Antrihabitans stalactiti TaxID=2584121 RepID=A0A848KRG2_9NOCA|nr:bifunctional 3-(3-hydroxy-phenyl)propionate/3-hydroxycinnamic acid hydroxylase [Antrihabitans stalactiti]NMN99152.1 bifunctional 3-(3-hydroxy-phenyl)propionate/3-hydroxycinnamic acid hydroxylase [Antrihabitans stalactiti]